MKRKIALVFAAAAIVMCFMNELQRHIVVSDNTLNVIGLFSYIIPIAMVLKIQSWRPQIASPSGIFSSLFFMLGAIALTLLFNRYWMEWARGFDPTGEILGKVRLVDATPSKSPLVENIFLWVLAPVGEEVVFRLGMLGIFSRIMPKGWALLLSSALFAFAHIYTYSWVQLVLVFIIGSLAGIIYLTTGLGFAILYHAIVNFWPYIKENFYGNQPLVLTLFSLLLLGLIVFFARIVRFRKIAFGSRTYSLGVIE